MSAYRQYVDAVRAEHDAREARTASGLAVDRATRDHNAAVAAARDARAALKAARAALDAEIVNPPILGSAGRGAR